MFQHCAIIKQLESDADRIINSVLTELSKHEIDATRLSNLTELLVQLGLATEGAKDAAEAIETVVLKRGDLNSSQSRP